MNNENTILLYRLFKFNRIKHFNQVDVIKTWFVYITEHMYIMLSIIQAIEDGGWDG